MGAGLLGPSPVLIPRGLFLAQGGADRTPELLPSKDLLSAHQQGWCYLYCSCCDFSAKVISCRHANHLICISLKCSCKNTSENDHRVKGIILAELMKNVISLRAPWLPGHLSSAQPWPAGLNFLQERSADVQHLQQGALPSHITDSSECVLWCGCHNGGCCKEQPPVDLACFLTATVRLPWVHMDENLKLNAVPWGVHAQ